MIFKMWGDFPGGRVAWGLLLIRLVFGGALVLHGLQKIGAPASWMNKFQPGVPAIFQFLAFLSEFGGGLALLFGLLTPLAALGVFFTMAVTAHGARRASVGWRAGFAFQGICVGLLGVRAFDAFSGARSVLARCVADEVAGPHLGARGDFEGELTGF